MRIGVIGAGPCGLTFLREILKHPELQVTCFERGSMLGGMWNLPSAVGIDPADKLPIHSSLYPDLTLNGPRYLAELPDYPIKTSEETWITHKDYLAYWQGFAADFNLARVVRLKSFVETVRKEGEGYVIEGKNTADENTFSEQFDAVVVCNGHYTKPYIPEFEGVSSFPGRVLHVRDYRSPKEFVGQRVLLVGNSLSADDINTRLQETAAQVLVSVRSDVPGFRYHLEKTEKCAVISRFEGSKVLFSDGEIREVDVVMYCTGYNFSFPFLNGDLNPMMELSGRHRFPLWRHLVHPEHARLLFPGLHYRHAAAQFYSQAKWTMQYFLGRIAPVPKSTRLTDIAALNSRWPKEAEEINAYHEVDFEFKLFNEYLTEAGEEPLNQVLWELYHVLLSFFVTNRTLCGST